MTKISLTFSQTIYAAAWNGWPGLLVAWISNQNYSGAMDLTYLVARMKW